jgi:hypothetical protein
MASEADEVVGLDKVLMRLALTDEDKVEKVLRVFFGCTLQDTIHASM